MMKNLVQGKPYLFEWNDTYSFQGWFTENEIDEKTLHRPLQTSYGIYLKTSGPWYIIATHKNTNGPYKPWADINWIPKGAVERVMRL